MLATTRVPDGGVGVFVYALSLVVTVSAGCGADAVDCPCIAGFMKCL